MKLKTNKLKLNNLTKNCSKPKIMLHQYQRTKMTNKKMRKSKILILKFNNCKILKEL